MNKDMINIDDFVREKLGGQTQKEDAGAWLKMKALLDEEMPEKAVPFLFRLSKPMAFLGAALLVGALCVGGYKLSALREKESSAQQNVSTINNNTNNNTNTNSSNTTDQTNNDNTTSDNDLQAPDVNLTANNTNAADNAINPVATENNNSIAAQHAARSENGSLADGSSLSNHTNSTANKMDGQSGQTGHSTGSTSPLASNHSGSGNRNALANTIGKNKATQQNKHSQPDASSAAISNVGHATASTQQKGTAGSKAARTYASDNTKADKNSARKLRNKNKSGTEKGTASDATNTANDKNVASTEKGKDSMNTITLVTKETVSKGYPKKTILKTDTINLGKVEVPTDKINNTIVSNTKPTEESVKQAAAEGKKANKQASKNEAARQKNTFASKNEAATQQKEAANTSSTSSKEATTTAKAKKEKNGIGAWIKNLDLPAAVADAKRDVRNANFYAGFSGGVNATVGNNNFQGVQFGPTGELVFNKHWSLFGAIRYFNRSGNKKTVNDNYSREIATSSPDSMKGPIWYYTVRTDSVNRFYNFSTVHSFELPITVRYTVRKFYLMTGINLAYYLPINVEQVEREYNNMNIHVVSLNATKPILAESKPTLVSTDFGSRFGLGYVIGAGYQIGPAWQADFRLVNSFWDNAKGAGAKSLSKDFYKLPSMQITIGYQFGRDRKKQTYGPTSTP